MHPREFLVDTVAHISPVRGLDALAHDLAERRLRAAPHSIAEIVAHMAFWQEWFLDRCEGIARPLVAHAADGWPRVAEGSWPAIHDRFVSGLERAAALTGLERAVLPAIEFPPLAHYSILDAVVHMAQHNSHHLGQVIVLRQMMGCWPPPGGGWTW